MTKLLKCTREQFATIWLEPSRRPKVLDYIEFGEICILLDESQTEFYKIISSRGIVGWINKAYMSVVPC